MFEQRGKSNTVQGKHTYCSRILWRGSSVSRVKRLRVWCPSFISRQR